MPWFLVPPGNRRSYRTSKHHYSRHRSHPLPPHPLPSNPVDWWSWLNAAAAVLAVFLASAALVISSVREGKKGDTGADGPQGPKGDKGKDGQDAAITVTHPSSSTDNAVVRFDGTDGITIQNSAAILDDNGVLTTARGDFGTYLATGVSEGRGAVFEHKVSTVVTADAGGIFTTDDVLGAVVTFTGFTAPRLWCIPSAANLDSALSFLNTTGVAWQFMVENNSAGSLTVCGNTGITVVGRIGASSTGVVPVDHFARIYMYKGGTNYTAHLFISQH